MQAIVSIPKRQELLDRFARANRFATAWIFVQLVLISVLLMWIDWPAIAARPLIPAVVVLYMIGSTLMSLLMLWAQQKKEIGDLKETTRFGEFDKHLLRRLLQDTMSRLGLPNKHLPVYIVADKQINAAALNLGLLEFISSLNGIYLNRQSLHRLSREEVQDVMGHELGHYFKYYLISERFFIVTLTLGALVGLHISQWIGQNDLLNMIVLGACGWGFWKLAGMPHQRHAQMIEFLCDDFGAHVHGVVVSINACLKIGVEQELQLALAQQVIKSKYYGNLSSKDIVAAIENAIPYGHTTREELHQAVEKSIERQAAKRQSASLGGFFDYVWSSDTDSDAKSEYEDTIAKAALLESIPRLNWEALLPDPQRIYFDEYHLPRLIKLIEQHPHHVMFHSLDAIQAQGNTHPPIKHRILYLWYNRHEIEQKSNQRVPIWATPSFSNT